MHQTFSKFRYTLALAAMSLTSATVLAQQPQIRAELDSMNIIVGSQVGLNVSVSVPKGAACHILQLPDTLSKEVEVVEALKPDTIDAGDLIEYAQRYIVTSFDTGLHYVGPIPLVIMGDSTQFLTPEIALSVTNPFQSMEVNEQGVNKICDINNAEDAPFNWHELLLYWPWLVGLIVVAGAIWLGIFLMKKYGRKKGGEENLPVVPEEPCDVTALRELERIRGEKLWLHNQVKEFYTDLTETLRRYIGERYGIQTKESTSAEIMEQLRKPLHGQPAEAERLASILETADLVKFAKMEPLAEENDKAITDSETFINATTETVKAKEATEAESAASLPEATETKEEKDA